MKNMNMKFFRKTIEEKTSVAKDWHKVGEVEMKTGEGIKKVKDSALKKEIMGMAKNGKSRKQIGDELVRRGVEIRQFEKRKKIDGVLKSLEK